MDCPSCGKVLSAPAVRQRRCDECGEEFVVGRWRPGMLLGGAAFGALAAYTVADTGKEGIVGAFVLGMIGLLLVLRARRG